MSRSPFARNMLQGDASGRSRAPVNPVPAVPIEAVTVVVLINRES